MNRYLSFSLVPLFLCGSLAAQGATFLFMESEPGDFVGQGETYDLDEEDGTFTASVNFDGGVSIRFDGPGGWNLDFAAPGNAPLEPGAYEGATRFPFQSPTEPGLSVTGQGRGCNTLTGRFVVLEVEYVEDTVASFAADFQQNCEGADPALFGSIRFNANVGFAPQLSVTANGSFEPITVAPGEPVAVQVSLQAGDSAGEASELWVGRVGPYSDFWLVQNAGWVRGNISPQTWATFPMTDLSLPVFNGPISQPGVYVFQVALDTNPDGVLDAEFVDHVVVIVR